MAPLNLQVTPQRLGRKPEERPGAWDVFLRSLAGSMGQIPGKFIGDVGSEWAAEELFREPARKEAAREAHDYRMDQIGHQITEQAKAEEAKEQKEQDYKARVMSVKLGRAWSDYAGDVPMPLAAFYEKIASIPQQSSGQSRRGATKSALEGLNNWLKGVKTLLESRDIGKGSPEVESALGVGSDLWEGMIRQGMNIQGAAHQYVGEVSKSWNNKNLNKDRIAKAEETLLKSTKAYANRLWSIWDMWNELHGIDTPGAQRLAESSRKTDQLVDLDAPGLGPKMGQYVVGRGDVLSGTRKHQDPNFATNTLQTLYENQWVRGPEANGEQPTTVIPDSRPTKDRQNRVKKADGNMVRRGGDKPAAEDKKLAAAELESRRTKLAELRLDDIAGIKDEPGETATDETKEVLAPEPRSALASTVSNRGSSVAVLFDHLIRAEEKEAAEAALKRVEAIAKANKYFTEQIGTYWKKNPSQMAGFLLEAYKDLDKEGLLAERLSASAGNALRVAILHNVQIQEGFKGAVEDFADGLFTAMSHMQADPKLIRILKRPYPAEVNEELMPQRMVEYLIDETRNELFFGIRAHGTKEATATGEVVRWMLNQDGMRGEIIERWIGAIRNGMELSYEGALHAYRRGMKGLDAQGLAPKKKAVEEWELVKKIKRGIVLPSVMTSIRKKFRTASRR